MTVTSNEIWKVNCSGSNSVLKTDGTLIGMEFDSASLPPIRRISTMAVQGLCNPLMGVRFSHAAPIIAG